MSHSKSQQWTVRVAVRVPRDGNNDLASEAARRLETAAEVDHVEVERVCGLEPSLAATVAGFDVQVVMTTEHARETVESMLETAPGTERVETMTPA